MSGGVSKNVVLHGTHRKKKTAKVLLVGAVVSQNGSFHGSRNERGFVLSEGWEEANMGVCRQAHIVVCRQAHIGLRRGWYHDKMHSLSYVGLTTDNGICLLPPLTKDEFTFIMGGVKRPILAYNTAHQEYFCGLFFFL